MDKPIITKTITEDGWTVTSDYGAQGVSTGIVHVPPPDAEKAARNRRELDRVLRRYGYRLADIDQEILT